MSNQQDMGDASALGSSQDVEPVKNGLDPSDLIPIAMPKDLLAKWLEALRSDKYTQTTDNLKDAFGYCCLGVLCEVAHPGDWRSMQREGSENLSDDALVEVGLTDKAQDFLAQKNDGGWPFKAIANLIEASAAAQGIETRRAETGTGSVHEHATAIADAPDLPVAKGL